MSERKGNSEILKQSYSILQNGPISVNELADKLGSNWATAKRALDTLEEIGLAARQETDGRKYFLKQELAPLVPQSSTLFNLPLSDKRMEICRALYAKIKTKWHEKNKAIPNKIQTQKIASCIARKFNQLDIPHVWYLYGNTLVLSYNPSEDYSDASSDALNSQDILKEIDSAINEFSKSKNSKEIMQIQYAADGAPKIYSTKLNLYTLLTTYDLDVQEVRNKLVFLLSQFRNELPQNEETKKIHVFLAEFNSTINRALQQKQINEFRPQIISTFQNIWGLTALYYFVQSAKAYFSEVEVRTNVEPKRNRIIIEAQENLLELEGLFPQNILAEDLPKFKFLTELKGSLKETPARTHEQRLKDYEEFKKQTLTGSSAKRTQ